MIRTERHAVGRKYTNRPVLNAGNSHDYATAQRISTIGVNRITASDTYGMKRLLLLPPLLFIAGCGKWLSARGWLPAAHGKSFETRDCHYRGRISSQFVGA